MYCVLLFPAFTVLTFYGQLVITKLFTRAYLPAVPVFYVYMLFLLRRCFNLDVLLRSGGRTGFILIGAALALAINAALLIPMHRQFGLIGPALCFIISEVALEIFYATWAGKEFQRSRAGLVDWRSVWKVAAGCLVGLPILIAAQFVPGPEIARAIVASTIFVTISWTIAYRMGVQDVGRLVIFGLSLIRNGPRSKARGDHSPR
jgi:O-antigen/teichoic acid export membrane protein